MPVLFLSNALHSVSTFACSIHGTAKSSPHVVAWQSRAHITLAKATQTRADLARGGGGRAKLKDLRHNGDDHKPPFLAGLDIGSLLKEYHGSSTSWSPLQGMGHCTSGKPLNVCYRQGMILLKNSVQQIKAPHRLPQPLRRGRCYLLKRSCSADDLQKHTAQPALGPSSDALSAVHLGSMSFQYHFD